MNYLFFWLNLSKFLTKNMYITIFLKLYKYIIDLNENFSVFKSEKSEEINIKIYLEKSIKYILYLITTNEIHIRILHRYDNLSVKLSVIGTI